MRRAQRERGSTSILVVICLTLCAGAILLSSGSEVDPLLREARLQHSRNAALALAEGGIAAARRSLAAGETPLRLQGVPLGTGWVDTWIEELGIDQVRVTAWGRVPGPSDLGPGARLTRRVRVRLDLSERDARGLPRVLSWQED